MAQPRVTNTSRFLKYSGAHAFRPCSRRYGLKNDLGVREEPHDSMKFFFVAKGCTEGAMVCNAKRGYERAAKKA